MNRPDMRLLTVFATSLSNIDQVTAVLDNYLLEYSVTDHSDGDSWTITALVPTHVVEPVEGDLQSLSLDFAVVVNKPMAVVETSGTEDPATPADRHVERLLFERISRSELRSKAEGQLPSLVIYVAMTAISGIVATTGVLIDSLAVLVGSMVIAPLLSPAMASSTATVLDDRELFSRGIRLQFLGLVAALASAVAFAAFARSSQVISASVDIEASLGLGSHGLPPSLLVTVAICSGIAGGLGMATSGMTDLIGVMIAAAIMPPIGVAGVGLVWNDPAAVTGSLVVVAVNVVAINAGAIATLWALGFHPREQSRIRATRVTILRRGLLLVTLLAAGFRVLQQVSASF